VKIVFSEANFESFSYVSFFISNTSGTDSLIKSASLIASSRFVVYCIFENVFSISFSVAFLYFLKYSLNPLWNFFDFSKDSLLISYTITLNPLKAVCHAICDPKTPPRYV
jgi:hypothetical protein